MKKKILAVLIVGLMLATIFVTCLTAGAVVLKSFGGNITISGHVYEVDTIEGITDAVVVACVPDSGSENGTSYTTYTDYTGAYHIEFGSDVTAGTVIDVYANAAGYHQDFKRGIKLPAENDTVDFNLVPKNCGPETPTINGPASGESGREYTYTTITTDPNGDQVWYMWDWGDGSFSEWLGPYNSGDTCEAPHTWDEKGTYNIVVRAKDEHDAKSDWSDPLSVSMPRNRAIQTPFLNFLQNHPMIFQLLQRFLKL